MSAASGAVRRVSRPAPLPVLFAKSLFTARFGGVALPADGVELADVRIDADQLATYQRVCGFSVRAELPSTFLHVLAFPLATELMAARAFPLPLPGLVHVANRVEQLRPVGSDEAVTLTVHAERLRPHPRGRQVDLMAVGRVDGEEVFRDCSTYLQRTSAGSSGSSGASAAGDSSGAGRSAPAAETAAARTVWRLPADIGRRYAGVSGDSNPIHLSALSARAFGFPRAIAHGMYVAARTLSALENRLPDAYVHDIAFKLPVLLPATVRFDAEADGSGWSLAVTSADGRKPHLSGAVAPV